MTHHAVLIRQLTSKLMRLVNTSIVCTRASVCGCSAAASLTPNALQHSVCVRVCVCACVCVCVLRCHNCGLMLLLSVSACVRVCVDTELAHQYCSVMHFMFTCPSVTLVIHDKRLTDLEVDFFTSPCRCRCHSFFEVYAFLQKSIIFKLSLPLKFNL